jgi:hypothetical protein
VYSCHHRVNNKGAQAVTVLNKIRKIRKYPNVVHDRINFGSVVLHLRGKSVARMETRASPFKVVQSTD